MTVNTHDHTALPKGRDIPFLLAGILGIGSSGPLIAKSSMPIPTLIFWRNLGGALIMAPFAIKSGEMFERKNRRLIAISALAGIFLAAHFLAFFAAMRFTSVAAGTALAALQPIFAALYMKIRGARISSQSLGGMFLAFASLLLITGVDFSLSTRAFEGDLFGILCSALAAAYMIIGSGVQKSLATSTYTTVCFSSCAVTTLFVSLSTGSKLVHFPALQWIYLAGLIIGAQFFGHTLFNMSLKRVSPVVVSLVVFFEVPVAAIIAWFWLHQRPSAGTIPGIFGLLIGCAIFVLRNKSDND
ncbi:MAG: DMT family transporter [Actinomycetes bacterium]